MLTASEDLTLSTLDAVKYNSEINRSKERISHDAKQDCDHAAWGKAGDSGRH
jgi:hypothetical protein